MFDLLVGRDLCLNNSTCTLHLLLRNMVRLTWNSRDVLNTWGLHIISNLDKWFIKPKRKVCVHSNLILNKTRDFTSSLLIQWRLVFQSFGHEVNGVRERGRNRQFSVSGVCWTLVLQDTCSLSGTTKIR